MLAQEYLSDKGYTGLAIMIAHCSDQRFCSISVKDVPGSPNATKKLGKHCRTVSIQAGLNAINIANLAISA